MVAVNGIIIGKCVGKTADRGVHLCKRTSYNLNKPYELQARGA